MFSMQIVDSDAFLDMPLSTQCLYFHLNMRADDDGFVNNPKRILRMIGCSDDDLKLLVAKRFIIPFESGVVVIKHWKIHNYIQKDRYKPTVYQEEKKMLEVKPNGGYKLLDTECIQTVSKLDTQVRLGKSKDSIDIYINNNTPISSGERVDLNDVFERTYAVYPRHEGKTRGKQSYIAYLTKGKQIKGQGRVRLNHQQIYFAVQAYAADVEDKDKQYIQHFDTFMNSTVLDYVDQTKADYEAWMAERYGEDWKNIKFVYEG